MKTITSLHNEWVKQLKLLQQRKGDLYPTFCLVEGRHLVEEAKKYGLLEHTMIAMSLHEKGQQADTVFADHVGQALSQQKTWSGWFGLCRIPSQPSALGSHYVYVDGVQDPGNVGTIIRTALAFGFSGVMLSEESADPWSFKALQSSQGATFSLPVFKVLRSQLPSFKQQGYAFLGGVLSDEAHTLATFDPPPQWILFLGHEGQGLSQEVREQLDYALMIPIQAIDSLNVGVAFGIFAFSLMRSRK